MAPPNKKPGNRGTSQKPGPQKKKAGVLANAQHWGRELIKHEFLTLIAKGIGWTFNNATYILSAVTGAYTIAVQYLIEATADLPLAAYVNEHPVRISLGAAAVASL